jgi:hypothetical protein
MSDSYFDEYDDAHDEFKDYEFLAPSVGEILKIVIWSGVTALLVICALINLI